MSEDEILEVIRQWKHFWMNQTQNSEADQQNYFNRAFGIDANMSHHLAKLIYDKMQPKLKINPDSLKDKTIRKLLPYIESECAKWADWPTLDEEDKEDTISGYETCIIKAIDVAYAELNREGAK
jgi:hypothetical protein